MDGLQVDWKRKNYYKPKVENATQSAVKDTFSTTGKMNNWKKKKNLYEGNLLIHVR